MGEQSSRVTILLSGGLDSTGLIPFYLARGAEIDAVHFEYGQPSGEGERQAARAVAQHYGVTIREEQLGITLASTQGEYHCRNAILLLAAAATGGSSVGTLAIGVHAGTRYYDCTEGFLHDFQRLLDGYFSGAIRVEAPFSNFEKPDVFEFLLMKEAPISLTYSCETESQIPCGLCQSCIDREMLFENFGIV